MAAVLQIASMQVVGDDGNIGSVNAGVHNSLQQTQSHVTGSGTFTHLQVDAVTQTLVNVLLAEGLVAGSDACSSHSGHVGAVDCGQVTLQSLTGHGQGVSQGLHQLGMLSQDVVANALGQTHSVLTAQSLADDLGVKLAAGGLQVGSKGNVGGNDEVNSQVGGLCFLQHSFDAFQAGNNADLVQVGHDAGGAVQQNALSEGTDCQGRAFGMDVAVQEAGSDVVALGVDDLGVLADAVSNIAHSSDLIATDSNATVVDFTGEDVYDLTVVNDQIGGLQALGNSEQFFHVVPPKIILFLWLINY